MPWGLGCHSRLVGLAEGIVCHRPVATKELAPVVSELSPPPAALLAPQSSFLQFEKTIDTGLGARKAGFRLLSLVPWPWASHRTYVGLTVLSCEMDIRAVPNTSHVCHASSPGYKLQFPLHTQLDYSPS